MWGSRVAPLAAAAVLAGCADGQQQTEISATPKPAARSSAPAYTPPTADPAPDLTATNHALRQLVNDYYSAVTDRDYESAWERLSSHLRDEYGGYDSWVQGHEATTSVEATGISAHATSLSRGTVTFSVESEDHDACGDDVSQLFKGTWTLARRAGTWIIKTSKVEKVTGATPVVDPAKCPDPGPSASSRSADAADDYDTTEVCYPAFNLPAVICPPSIYRRSIYQPRRSTGITTQRGIFPAPHPGTAHLQPAGWAHLR